MRTPRLCSLRPGAQLGPLSPGTSSPLCLPSTASLSSRGSSTPTPTRPLLALPAGTSRHPVVLIWGEQRANIWPLRRPHPSSVLCTVRARHLRAHGGTGLGVGPAALSGQNLSVQRLSGGSTATGQGPHLRAQCCSRTHGPSGCPQKESAELGSHPTYSGQSESETPRLPPPRPTAQPPGPSPWAGGLQEGICRQWQAQQLRPWPPRCPQQPRRPASAPCEHWLSAGAAAGADQCGQPFAFVLSSNATLWLLSSDVSFLVTGDGAE